MANCRYELKNGTKFDSFADLLNNFVDKEIKDFNSLSDVVFSKYQKRDNLREQLVKVSKEYIPKRRVLVVCVWYLCCRPCCSILCFT